MTRLSLFISGLGIILAGLGLAGAGIGAQSEERSVDVTIGVGDTILIFSGRVAPNSLVTFSENDVAIGTTTSDAAGNFSKTFTAQDPGIRTFEIFATTPSAENTDTISVTIDVVEHATTTVDLFLPTTISLSDDDVNKGETILVKGQTVPNLDVIITIDNTTDIQTTADADGFWQIIVETAGLSGGIHSLFAVVKDGAAQSSPTEARSFRVITAEDEAEEEAEPPGRRPDIGGLIRPPAAGDPSFNLGGLNLLLAILAFLFRLLIWLYLLIVLLYLLLGLSLSEFLLLLMILLILMWLLAYWLIAKSRRQKRRYRPFDTAS